MKILILGGTGFIGEAIFQGLVAEHEVIIASRKHVGTYPNWRPVDFAKENDWPVVVAGIDLVINAIGIISGDFTKVQTTAPMALFTYCAQQKIKIINISAIGAERDNPPNPFLNTKNKLDTFLLNQTEAKVIYPGIVLGPKGKRSRFFKAISEFPIIPLIGGDPPLVHISQLVLLIKKICNDFDAYPNKIFAIAKAETMKDLYRALRGKNAFFIPSPSWPARLMFSIFPKLEIGIFNKNMASMIDEIDVSDYEPIFEKTATSFVQANQVKPSSDLVKVLAVVTIFIVWLWSGISSLVSWETSESLMASIGISGSSKVGLFIWLGAIVDILLAFGLFWRKHRKKILLAQIGFVVVYTLILTIFNPILWMHPFGVLTKNLPLIVLTWRLIRNYEL